MWKLKKLAHLVLSLAALGTNAVGQAASDRQVIRIFVYNRARVPDRHLRHGTAIATYVVAKAGIEANWLECPTEERQPVRDTGCEQQLRSTDLVLTILPSGAKMAHGPHDLGLALQPEDNRLATYAYIWYDRVRSRTVASSWEGDSILGHAMAHEIGHLLLGSNSHAYVGLMSAHWFNAELRRASRGALLFTSSEQERLRAALERRRAAGRP